MTPASIARQSAAPKVPGANLRVRCTCRCAHGLPGDTYAGERIDTGGTYVVRLWPDVIARRWSTDVDEAEFTRCFKVLGFSW